MGGLPWIKVATDFADHPKAHALVLRLGDPRAALHLPPGWGHFARHYADGSMPDTESAIRAFEAAARWGGEPGALVEALVEVGLLERKRKRLAVHGWNEWQAPHAVKLERDRDRMRAKRAEARGNGRATVAGASRDGRAEEETERREEDLPPNPPRTRGGTRTARLDAARRRGAVVGGLELAGVWLDRDGADDGAVSALVERGASAAEVTRRLRRLQQTNPGARPAELLEKWLVLADAPAGALQRPEREEMRPVLSKGAY